MVEDLESIPSLVPKLLLQLLALGSITDAALVLGVSQPAASKALRRAEDVLGFALVRRDSRPLLLTEEGRLIAEFAKKQELQGGVLLRQLRLIQKDGAGQVKVASFGASASTHILPSLIHAISQHLPQVKIEISEFTDEGALLALREGRVDFAIAVEREYLDLDIIPVFTDRMVALVHEDDPLSQLPVLSAVDIEDRDFILSKGGSEALIREWFKLSKSRLKEKHTIVQLTSILALIRAGLGVSIVAELAVPESHPSVNVIPLAPEYPRNICVAKRSGCFSSNAARLTWDFLSKNRSHSYLSKRGH